MKTGRTIRIYLSDGSISGIRHAEIVNWTGQAISVPRSHIAELNDWQESRKPGVYFLFGASDTDLGQAAYIGEAENVFDRIKHHVANKDFWNELIFFTNKDENLTKSHVKYLESRLCQMANEVGRYQLLNGNSPQLPVLPRGDRDAMEEFLLNIKILLGVLGHRLLEKLSKAKASGVAEIEENLPDKSIDNKQLYLNVKDSNAKAVITDEGIVVVKGSFAVVEDKSSLSIGYRKLKQELVLQNVLEENENVYVFMKDQLFKSPTQAASIIVGYSINGRQSWQDNEGNTLGTLEETGIR